MNFPEGSQLRADLRRALKESGEEPSERAVGALGVHLRLLARWNPRYGLTRIQRWEEVLDRHVKESLLPLRWIGSEGRLLDVGSGNGFPAIPILICRPDLKGTLVERSDRKALFLDAVVREAGLRRTEIVVKDLGPRSSLESARLSASRASAGTASRSRASASSDVADALSGPFDYVISRATLSPDRLMSLSLSWSCPGGRVFIYGGASLASRIGRGSAAATTRTKDRTEGGFRKLARESIPGRSDSFLWVFQTGT